MAMVTLTSTYNTNLSQTLPFEKNNSIPRDAYFSTFPSGAEENHVRKVSEPSRDISPKITNQDEYHYSRRKEEEDGEIGIFEAEKYFNGGIDHVDSLRLTKIDANKLGSVKNEGVSLEPIKPVIHQGTPSVGSESSWNSQSALLQSFMRNPPRPKPSNKVNGKSFLSGLAAGCKCYCFDKNSVDIEEVQVGEISFKRPANGKLVQGKQNKTAGSSKGSLEVNKASGDQPWIKEDLFVFPTMNSTVGKIRPVKVPLEGDQVDEIGRKSLEVFGSPLLGRKNKYSLNLERRLKMLSWDATPKVEETEYCKGNYINDTESDASSDLFEIESFTGKGNIPFLARQASEAASGCLTPTTCCYAPSEASIEWSVATASAADFSVMSDYEELIRPSISLASPIKTFSATTINAKTKHNTEVQRRRSSGLLGCNSDKAVKVAGDAYNKTNEKAGFDPRMRRVSDSFMPVTRFRAETH